MGPIPVLSLSLSPEQLEVEVTQSKMGAVTFNGTVTVDQMRIMHSMVTLTAMVSTGWPVVISPQTIEFNGPGQETYKVSVIVPPATSSYIAGNVQVTGTCKAPGLAPVVAACSAVVTVSPYYRANMASDDPDVILKGGEEAEVEVRILNSGNVNIRMRVTIALKPDDIQIRLSNTEFEVLQDETHNLTVRVVARSGVSPGDYMVGLRVEAVFEDGGTQELTIFNISVYIPSITARMGRTGIISMVIIIGAAVGVVAMWRMGKLKDLRRLVPPKTTKTTKTTRPDDP